ncbi:hypothetical protein Aab01nite_08220 [Paractinoplanes abujensis]|uniref:Uncharacterized protein n=1 Tax=Paractinoplanes abujensis TaxID=882441 RepID=A0A7W7CMP2_9ACTN|nr:hypothetical protein [Actinoplanes abujensis]MBB4691352.1 hypothetical protein [Actinoplanes abujensis]GID17232.1 hypothetical protein Aab01nite_08220 [Actinoplanes abujensis]
MVFPYAPTPGNDGPAGDTYAVALVRAGDAEPVTAVLRRLRFTGWAGAPESGWLPVIAAGGTVAAGRRGIVEVGAELAGTVLVVRVLRDRQLALVAWSDGEELGRYVSDPSREPGAEDDVLDDPLGVPHAAAFAQVAGRPDRADDLAGLLGDRLDPELVNESERLAAILRLLDLPTWLVAVATLPRDIPTGPRARELTRFGFGLPGVRGKVLDRAARPVRRRRTPPPVIADPPSGGGMDPWLL